MNKSLLQLDHVTKRFPGVLALDDVQFELRSGEVHVIMGENGAGKSTLMKIADGIYRPDEGEMRINGEQVTISSPTQAIQHGIAMIHQELNAVLDMTVAENIYLGKEPGNGLFVDRRKMCQAAREALAQLRVEINPNAKMRDLSVAKRQMVEIAKAVSRNAQIIIMDEPTSAISDKEVDALFAVVRMFRERGAGIIYISHKMDEIFRIADRITVMRDGKTIGTYQADELNNDKLISLMVGRELTNIYPPKPERVLGETALEVLDLTNEPCFRHVSLSVRRGEILGIAGLMGAGRSELVETLFGMRKAQSGTVKINGTQRRIRSPKDAIAAGMALVTEDRKQTGLNLKTTIKKDMSIVSLSQFCTAGQFIRDKQENAAVDDGIRRLEIKTPGRNQMVTNLSGGNQQKVIIARWLMSDPDIIIMDEPTRGIDVGAKYEIYAIMMELAAQGKAILMVSSEMPEIIGVCDRVVVMHEGRLTGELSEAEMNQEAIMALASGMEAV